MKMLSSLLIFGLWLILSVNDCDGTENYINFIEEGKYTIEDINKDLNLDKVPSPGLPGPHFPGLPPIPWIPDPSGPAPAPIDELNYKTDFAFFPSPDDDGTFLKVDMSEEPSLTFHIPADIYGIRPTSIVMSFAAFPFRPKIVKPEDIKFYLFTKKNPNKRIEMFSTKSNKEIVQGYWNPDAEVKILCHGFQSSSEKKFPTLMKNSYLKLEKDLNVVLIDWSKLAENKNYFEVTKQTFGVGEEIATFIQQLIKEKLSSVEKIHFIGHSIGAHVGGATGFSLQHKYNRHVERITGLDPAGPGYCNGDIGQLEMSDAKFVDVIHTDDSYVCEGWWKWIWNQGKGRWGSDKTVGHATFFPNGGREQPGCDGILNFTCSHSRAYYYFEESFNGTITQFESCPCSSYDDYLHKNCKCSKSNTVIMGEHAPKTEGKYFLRTGNQYPFSHVV